MTDTSAIARAGVEWQVLRNGPGRCSVWPMDVPVPDGWLAVDVAGDREACLRWIAENWTDPRPAGVGRPVR